MGQDYARHLDIDAAWKAVQRNLGHRCLHAGLQAQGVIGNRSSHKPSARQAVRVAVLGRNALGDRATAVGPASKISAQALQSILSRVACITTASFLRVSGARFTVSLRARGWRR